MYYEKEDMHMEFFKKKSNIIMMIIIVVLIIAGILGASIIEKKTGKSREGDEIVQEVDTDTYKADIVEENQSYIDENGNKEDKDVESKGDSKTDKTQSIPKKSTTISKPIETSKPTVKPTQKPEETKGPTAKPTQKLEETEKPSAIPKATETKEPTGTPESIEKKEPTAPPTPTPEPTPAKKVCTVSIYCDSVLSNMDKLTPGKESCVPSNGCIMGPRTVEFHDGETVFDTLVRACGSVGIQLEYAYTPAYGSYYIEGINNLYEFDCGNSSGWKYKVNGSYPNYGCSQYVLSDGDNIVWSFTCSEE